MQIYMGPSEVIRAVTRVGSNGVAALADSGVSVWESEQPDQSIFLKAVHKGFTHSDLQSSPDGEWLAAHGGGRLWCWRRAANGWTLTVPGTDLNVCAIAFPDPGVLDIVMLKDRTGVGVDVHMERRNLGAKKAKGETLAVFPAPDGLDHAADLKRFNYYCVAYSPGSGVFLFSPTDRFQYLWDTREPRLLGSIKMRSTCNGAALSPDGTIAAIDGGTTTYLYRVATQELIGTWRVRHCYAPQLAWYPDGRMLLRADFSTTVRQFDLASGAEVAALGLRRHRATAVRFSPDGLTYLVGTFKGSVVVWDVE